MIHTAPGVSPAAIEWARFQARQQQAEASHDPEDDDAARAALIRFHAAFRGVHGERVTAPGGPA